MRNDAILVTVRRDGTIYFGSEQTVPDHLTAIREKLRDGSPRKAYIQADARARYRPVKEVLDGAQLAGIQDIAFYAR